MSNQVAQTILNQLGRGRFIAMTGAKSMLAAEAGLHFRLPSNFAKSGTNAVHIDLVSDLYNITTFKVRGTVVVQTGKQFGVYADQLRAAFTEMTGLDTSL